MKAGIVWEGDSLRIVAAGNSVTLEERIGANWLPASAGHPAYGLFEAIYSPFGPFKAA